MVEHYHRVVQLNRGHQCSSEHARLECVVHLLSNRFPANSYNWITVLSSERKTNFLFKTWALQLASLGLPCMLTKNCIMMLFLTKPQHIPHHQSTFSYKYLGVYVLYLKQLFSMWKKHWLAPELQCSNTDKCICPLLNKLTPPTGGSLSQTLPDLRYREMPLFTIYRSDVCFQPLTLSAISIQSKDTHLVLSCMWLHTQLHFEPKPQVNTVHFV